LWLLEDVEVVACCKFLTSRDSSNVHGVGCNSSAKTYYTCQHSCAFFMAVIS